MSKKSQGRLRAVVLTCVAVLGLQTMTATPARALHQYCGSGAEGIHLGGYAGETRGNGHPQANGDGGWAGGAALGEAKNARLTINRIKAFLGLGTQLLSAQMFVTPTKALKTALTIARLALTVAEVAADAVVMEREQRNAEMDACNDVLGGDTIDLLFLAQMQAELGEYDPADGTVEYPSNILQLPDDGSPGWTEHSERYTDRPSDASGEGVRHEDLKSPYVDGFVNVDYIGVATMVRNTIAHLEAHGIDTGGGHVWEDGRLVYRDGAKDVWWDAMRLLEDGRVRRAYATFAEAYQMAVTAHHD
ncbi:MAG TPA: hypothetical protein VHG70_14480 [Nocardioidaceae bacterium]|nr:hypothetical protein [Nocardioidaceae bacterium]